MQLRLLRSTLDVKLDQFERIAGQRLWAASERPVIHHDRSDTHYDILIRHNAATNRAISRRAAARRSSVRTKRCRRWWICIRCFAPG